MTFMPSKPAKIEVLLNYQRLLQKRRIIICCLLIMVVVVFLTDLATGPAMLSPKDVLQALSGYDVERRISSIVLGIRLPAAVLAILVGAALSLAGMEMQTLLDNPMASPFTLGLSSAATLGAALAIIAGVSIPFISGDWFIFVNAFLMALFSAFLLHLLARFYNNDTSSIVLFGIALLFAFNALVALIQFFASERALQQLVFWTMGSLERADWPKIYLLTAVLIIVFSSSWKSVPAMNALQLGKERAVSLGVDMNRYSYGVLVRVSLLTGTAISIVGVIGFVGLVGPHIARLLVGEDQRYTLPATVLCGALIVSIASILSRMMIDGIVLPIGLVTAIVGVPLFMALILRSGARH
ncbi:FecCD family ABC transporter permease [Brucellaceae bacterium C25G]